MNPIYFTRILDEDRIVSGKRTFALAFDEWNGKTDLRIETFFAQRSEVRFEVHPALSITVPSLPTLLPPSK